MGEHKTEKEIKAINREIKAFWGEVCYKVDSQSIQNYAKELLNICKAESKAHDNFRSDGIPRGLTLIEESRLFALQRVLTYLYDLENKPDIKEFLHYQKSVFYAYALAKEHEKVLKECITLETAKRIKAFDYCELI